MTMAMRGLLVFWVLGLCTSNMLSEGDVSEVPPSTKPPDSHPYSKSGQMSVDIYRPPEQDNPPPPPPPSRPKMTHPYLNHTNLNIHDLNLCPNITSITLLKECLCRQTRCYETMNAGCRNFEFIVSFVLVGLTCLFGLIGNVLSILTLQRDSIKSVTTFLLSALAVADFAFLIPAVFVIMIPTYCEIYQHCARVVREMIPHFERFGWAIASTTHSCTVYVTVLVALHRYLWVCKPGLAQKLSGLNRAKFQVAIVPVCALIYNSPRFMEYRINHVTSNDTQVRAETIKDLSPVGNNKYFQIIYKNVCFFIIMYLIPLAILVLVSVNLIRTLRQRRATLQRIGSTNSNASQVRRDDNITFVLIIIIVVFIVCQTPTMVQRLLLAMAKDGRHTCGYPYFYLEHIADYMALLNSSTNFVIYILFSPHFRRTLTSEVLCKGDNTPASVAMKHFSRLSKTYKKPSDEKKSTLIPREARPIDVNDANSGHNSHMTGSNQQVSNGQNKGPHQLTPPYNMDKSASITVSTQVTSHEFLTSSHVDVNDPEANHRESRRGSGKTGSEMRAELNGEPEGGSIDRSPDSGEEEREIIIPLIAFERASSSVDT